MRSYVPSIYSAYSSDDRRNDATPNLFAATRVSIRCNAVDSSARRRYSRVVRFSHATAINSCRRTGSVADEPSTVVNNYIRAERLEKTIPAIVYPDRRGEGYGIGRYEDHPRLEFSRVESEADVHFTNKTGVM